MKNRIKAHHLAACYWDTPEGRVFSLRSNDEGVDVSEVAKQYGQPTGEDQCKR